MSHSYVGQSCQPTRAALVTGGYQNRIGNEVVGDNTQGLPGTATTIFDRMKAEGYNTAAVGKWHLGSIDGQNRPQDTGVDDFFGIWHGSRTYALGNTGLRETQLLRETTVAANGTVTDTVVEGNFRGEYFTNAMGDYAVDYIADKHNDANPFFLYQSFTAPHTPLQNSPDFNDPRLSGLTGTQKTYASMMLTMDKEIGRMMDRLDDPNGDGNTADSISDDTLIVFVNDNGGADANSSSPNGADNGNLRAGKGSSFEGGIRVPMIIAGAGVDASARGTVYSQNVHGVDVLSTVMGAAGVDVGVGDPGLDGVNLIPFINGDNGGAAPHEVLVNRHRKQFAVIKGDLRLVNNGGSNTNNHQLYDLSTDIGQTNNIAASNAELVAELQRDLTDHEVTFDKQRYAILGTTAEDTINTFDHFVFNPSDPTTSGVDIIAGSTGNGDFNNDSGSPLAFDEVSNWHNLEGSDSNVNFGINAGNNSAAPQTGSQAAFLFGNAAINDTGHTITAAGEVFDLSLFLHQQGNGYDGDEVLNAFLFTSTNGVNANTTLSDISILGMTNPSFNVSGVWTEQAAAGFFVSQAADIGKTVYLGLDLDNPAGGNVFPRIDVVELSVNGLSTGGSSVTNWSDSAGWLEAGTSNVERMFNSDAFAGAVLEFGTTDSFSYVSNNDMVRETGLEFMLNKIVLSGSFNGVAAQSGTIQGNELLLVKNLQGAGPEIAIDANDAGVAGYTYDIDMDLLLYDDLAFTGDGDVAVNVNGQIRDYSESRGITKRGTSTVTLTGENTYSGDTIIEEGTLALSGDGSISDSSFIDVKAGAVFDVSGRTGGALTLVDGQLLGGSGEVTGTVIAGSGSTISPGASPGILTIDGDLTLQSGSSLLIELAGETEGTEHDKVVVTGLLGAGGDLTVSLDGGFALDNSLDYTFDILDFDSSSGQFANLFLPTFSNGRIWDSGDLYSEGVLRLSAAAVPEPGCLALLGLGVLGFAGRRRRKV